MSRSPQGYREALNNPSTGDFTLRDCPICGADLTGRKHTHRHFLEEHGPSEFGLSPIGEGRR